MTKYVYRFADGTANDIELPDDWAKILMELDHKEGLNNRRETRRHQSLDKLLENDGFLIVSKDPDPLEILLQKEQNKQMVPILTVLTKQQREAARLFYLEGYSKVEIARKLKIDESAVRKRLKKANEKILDLLSLS